MFYKSRRINFIINNILIFYLLLTVFKICLRFLDNPKISAQMIWESYPVLLIFIFLFVFFIGLKYLFELSFLILFKNQHVLKMKQKIFGITIFGFIILFSLWGTLKQYPLRWSDAFFSNNSFISALRKP